MRVVRFVLGCSVCCLLLSLVSCGSKTPENTGPIGEVSVLDSVVFYLEKDVFSPLKSAGGYQYIPEENQLAYLNTYPRTGNLDEKQSIKFFDFNTGEVVNTILLDKRGGHGFVLIPTNFYYQSQDSIWVYPARVKINDRTEGVDYHELGLVNSKGQVEMRPSLIPNALRPGMSKPMSKRYGAIVRRGRELIVSATVSWGRRGPATPFYTLDTRNAKADVLGLKPYQDMRPTKTFKNQLNGFRRFSEVRSIINNRDELVSNFPLDHSLSVIDRDGDVERVVAKSRYLTMMPDVESETKDVKAVSRVLDTAGYYAGLLYDNGKDQYYRIVRLPRSTIHEVASYTVMVMNNKFELIAESMFNGDRYFFEKGVFVAQGGLFVLSNPKSADKMTFMKLGIAQKE